MNSGMADHSSGIWTQYLSRIHWRTCGRSVASVYGQLSCGRRAIRGSGYGWTMRTASRVRWRHGHTAGGLNSGNCMNRKLIRWFYRHVCRCGHVTATGLCSNLGQRWRSTVGYGNVGWGAAKREGRSRARGTGGKSLA